MFVLFTFFFWFELRKKKKLYIFVVYLCDILTIKGLIAKKENEEKKISRYDTTTLATFASTFDR